MAGAVAFAATVLALALALFALALLALALAAALAFAADDWSQSWDGGVCELRDAVFHRFLVVLVNASKSGQSLQTDAAPTVWMLTMKTIINLASRVK
jgi:hypothetical protein